MPISTVISYAAAYLCLIVAAAVLIRDRHSFVHRTFAVGSCIFAAEELLRAFSYAAVLPADVLYWQKRVITVSALIPAVWLAFSLSYARVDWKRHLFKWKWVLLVFGAA